MKKLILPLAFVFLITSCKKEDVIVKEQKPIQELAVNPANHVITVTETSMDYNTTIFDSCLNDSVEFHGLERSIISQYDDSTGSWLRYEIDLSNIKGIAKISKRVYEGGGKIVNVVKNSFDGQSLKGVTKMKIVFKSDKDKIVLKQNALFIQKNGVIKVQFDTGYLETCKIF